MKTFILASLTLLLLVPLQICRADVGQPEQSQRQGEPQSSRPSTSYAYIQADSYGLGGADIFILLWFASPMIITALRVTPGRRKLTLVPLALGLAVASFHHVSTISSFEDTWKMKRDSVIPHSLDDSAAFGDYAAFRETEWILKKDAFGRCRFGGAFDGTFIMVAAAAISYLLLRWKGRPRLASNGVTNDLTRLAILHQRGDLSEDEYKAAKATLLQRKVG